MMGLMGSCGSLHFFGLAIFLCSVRELFFAISTDWFFLLGVNFCDFLKVPSTTVCVPYVNNY